MLHSIDPPNVTVSPASTIINRSSELSVELTCEAFGIPPPTLTWSVDKTGQTLTTDTNGVEIDTTDNGDGTTTSVLTISEPRDPDESNYTCSAVNGVTNVLGTAESGTAELFVQGLLVRERTT